MKLGTSSSSIPSGKGLRVAVAVSDFNALVTDALLSGCLETLKTAGVKNVTVVRVPGAFELPLACQKLAKKRDAVIALGCVIRGETPHDRYICQAVSYGLMRAGLKTGVPVIFGVLTPLDEAQAKARLGKGREAAVAALQMARLAKDL